MGRVLGQNSIQRFGRGRRWYFPLNEDLLRTNFTTVETVVPVPVLSEHCPRERQPRKQTARPRVAKDLSVKLHIRCRA